MKIEITDKHIDALIGHNVVLLFTFSGNFKGQFYGKVIGRLRTRFKHYIFVPNTPFVSFYFSVSDVESIEDKDGIYLLKIQQNHGPQSEKKPRRKKKTVKSKKTKNQKNKIRKKVPVVKVEPNIVVDLSNTVSVSPQSSSETTP